MNKLFFFPTLSSSNSNQLGRPGIPGSNDLETALRRLLVKRNWGLPDKDGKTVPGSTKHAELLQRSIMEQSFRLALSSKTHPLTNSYPY